MTDFMHHSKSEIVDSVISLGYNNGRDSICV